VFSKAEKPKLIAALFKAVKANKKQVVFTLALWERAGRGLRASYALENGWYNPAEVWRY
jgi:hypothetical protein